jgi:hypothetical protein
LAAVIVEAWLLASPTVRRRSPGVATEEYGRIDVTADGSCYTSCGSPSPLAGSALA